MNLISYYPTYTELDDLLAKHNPKRVNIYLDLKNALQTLYIDEAVSGMLEVTSNTDAPNSMIYLSWLDFIQFHYQYMLKRNMDIHIYTIADVGDYVYHRAIFKDYKANRNFTKTKTLSFMYTDKLHKILVNNIEAIMDASDGFYNCNGIYLKHCESDFVSHYLISKHFTEPETLNVIYSADKDMIQALVYPNAVQFVKVGKNKKFVDSSNWSESYDIPHLDVGKYIYMKSMIGDTGDGVKGITGIGNKSAYKIMKEMPTPTNFKDFMSKLEELSLRSDSVGKLSKKVNTTIDVVYMNYRLMSFDELISNLHINTIEYLEKTDDSNNLSLDETLEVIETTQRRLVEIAQQV